MNNGEENGMYKYFPYSPIREPQKEIIPIVNTFLHNDDFDGLILSAASGIGKTACMTSQSLLVLEEKLFDRVIFTIPTDIAKENIIKEFASVRHNKRVIKVYSKDILCNWLKDIKDERISALESGQCAFYLCRSQGHKCKYKDNDCEYESQKKEIQKADILICDYNYIISAIIRTASGFEDVLQYRTLLFIDECHMLRNRAEMILAKSMSSATVDRAIMELEEYGYDEEKEIVQNMLKFIKKEVGRNYQKLGSQMEKNYEGFGEIILRPSVMQEFCYSEELGERLIEIGAEVSAKKFEQKRGIISYSEMVGNFIKGFYRRLPYKDSNVFFLKLKNDMSTVHIGWTPLDVRGFLRNAIKKSSKYVLFSGTIKPLRLRNDVGLAFEKVMNYGPVESPYLINRQDIILTKERFCDTNFRDESFLKRIDNDIERLFAHMTKPIGIVSTNRWYENLDRSLDLSSRYEILNEPEKQEHVEDWLKNLIPKAEIVRFSPYGRVAQSVDISHLKSIIFLGFPYPKVGPIMEERIRKMMKSFKGKSGNVRAKAIWVLIIEPAYEKIIQSVMRGLRNENDRLNVIYYDVAYKMNKPALGSKNLVVCQTIDEAISHLAK